MKKLIIILTSMFVLIPSIVMGVGANLAWNPTTNTILNNDCNQVGPVVTQPIIYTLQWRLKTTNPVTWENATSAECPTNGYSITGLVYETEYETRVGAHYAGKSAFCFTDPITFTTPLALPPSVPINITITIH